MKRPIRDSISDSSLSILGIPKKFRDVTIDSFLTYKDAGLASLKKYISDYVSDIPTRFTENEGIIFLGSNGVGKTLLSCLIMKEAYRNRYSAKRVTFVEYITLYTRAWGASSRERIEYEEELYARYKSVEFLVLEEVGKEIDSKVSAPILEDLLRYREDKGLVTIICTNLTKNNLQDKYGSSVMSLISGNMTPIVVSSQDRRASTFKSKVGDNE